MDARRLLIAAAGALAAAAPPAALAEPVAGGGPPAAGRAAIVAANRQARARSAADRFVGGLQVFADEPGRVYEVWTAPLRVTTLILRPGETIAALAAGDTVRWQIAETAVGEGPSRRVHILVKPLERDLETNLVIATTARIYLVQLRSGAAGGHNVAVAWDAGALLPPPQAAPPEPAPPPAPPPSPERLDARYRITHKGRRPAWTPTAVMTDGTRTYIAFPPQLASAEAPLLFALGPDGAAELVNYRQLDGVFIADRALVRAQLRLGDARPQVVDIAYVGEGSP